MGFEENNMQKIIVAFLGVVGMASAFVTPQTSLGFTATALQASPRPVIAAVAGVIPAIVCSSAALATEGTNEWLVLMTLVFWRRSSLDICLYFLSTFPSTSRLTKTKISLEQLITVREIEEIRSLLFKVDMTN